jgi:hypothetical protein
MLDSALYSNLQWYGSSGIINGANQSFFPATLSGLYYIVATDEFGCSYSSDPVSLGLNTSLESKPFSGIVKVGPNPVSNGSPLTIYIQNAEFSDVTIVLMDLYWREIIRRVVNPSFFPYRFTSQEISELSNGLYFLDISFDENKIRKKIIKTGTN